MVKGLEYVNRCKSVRESIRKKAVEHAYTSKEYDEYLKVLSRNKTIWMFYALFGFLSLASIVFIVQGDRTLFGVTIKIFTLVNIIILIALSVITNHYKKVALYKVDREKKKVYSTFEGLKEASDKVAKVCALSYVLSHSSNYIELSNSPKFELLKLTKEYIEKTDLKNMTTEEFEVSFNDWLMSMEK